MIAARGGQPAAVDAVLAAHPNVNAADKNGNTALMHAVMSGSLAVVDKLIAAGASVAPRDVQEWSALDFAEVSGATGIAARQIGRASCRERVERGGAAGELEE